MLSTNNVYISQRENLTSINALPAIDVKKKLDDLHTKLGTDVMNNMNTISKIYLNYSNIDFNVLSNIRVDFEEEEFQMRQEMKNVSTLESTLLQSGHTLKNEISDHLDTSISENTYRQNEIILSNLSNFKSDMKYIHDQQLITLHNIDLLTETTWYKLGTTIHGENINQIFGHHIQLDNTGSTLIVSSKNSNKIYIYKYDNLNNKWNVFHLFEENEYYNSIALSGDGLAFIVGNSTFEDNKGITKTYNFDTKRNKWYSFSGNLIGLNFDDKHGSSISMNKDGKIIAVSSIGYNKNIETGILENVGCVRVYEYDTMIGQWNLLGNIIEGITENQNFGKQIKLSDTGKEILIIEPTLSNNTSGCYVLRLQNNIWTQMGHRFHLVDEINYIDSEKIIDLSNSGKYVVTTNKNNTVIAYFFNQISNQWEQKGSVIHKNVNQVNINFKGNRIIMSDMNHVYVYKWISLDWDLEHTFHTSSHDKQIDLNSYGNVIAYSLSKKNKGEVYVFKNNLYDNHLIDIYEESREAQLILNNLDNTNDLHSTELSSLITIHNDIQTIYSDTIQNYSERYVIDEIQSNISTDTIDISNIASLLSDELIELNSQSILNISDFLQDLSEYKYDFENKKSKIESEINSIVLDHSLEHSELSHDILDMKSDNDILMSLLSLENKNNQDQFYNTLSDLKAEDSKFQEKMPSILEDSKSASLEVINPRVTSYIMIGENWRIQVIDNLVTFQYNAEPENSFSKWIIVTPHIRQDYVSNHDVIIYEGDNDYSLISQLVTDEISKYEHIEVVAYTAQFNMISSLENINYIDSELKSENKVILINNENEFEIKEIRNRENEMIFVDIQVISGTNFSGKYNIKNTNFEVIYFHATIIPHPPDDLSNVIGLGQFNNFFLNY